VVPTLTQVTVKETEEKMLLTLYTKKTKHMREGKGGRKRRRKIRRRRNKRCLLGGKRFVCKGVPTHLQRDMVWLLARCHWHCQERQRNQTQHHTQQRQRQHTLSQQQTLLERPRLTESVRRLVALLLLLLLLPRLLQQLRVQPLPRRVLLRHLPISTTSERTRAWRVWWQQRQRHRSGRGVLERDGNELWLLLHPLKQLQHP